MSHGPDLGYSFPAPSRSSPRTQPSDQADPVAACAAEVTRGLDAARHPDHWLALPPPGDGPEALARLLDVRGLFKLNDADPNRWRKRRSASPACPASSAAGRSRTARW
jgi:hypothetical protein